MHRHTFKHLRLVGDNMRSLSSDQIAMAARESTSLWVLPMLALAEHRITHSELAALEALCALQPQELSRRQIILFRFDYWTRLADAARSGTHTAGILSWIRATAELEERLDAYRNSAGTTSIVARYRELTRALRRQRGAVEYWLALLEPVFDATEARLRAPDESSRR